MIKINNVDGYINLIISLQERYANSSSYSMFDNMVYRGLTRESYKLEPTLFRTINKKDYLKSGYFYQHSKGNLDDCILMMETDLSFHEQQIIQDFKRESVRYLPNHSNFASFSIVELAQHYGVPTRLLDWTTNPLVALYFACKDIDSEDGAVWMLNKYKYSMYSNYRNFMHLSVEELFNIVCDNNSDIEVSKPVLFMPNYLDERMASQASVFMMWGHDRSPLDDMLSNENFMSYKLDSKDNYRKQKQTTNKHCFAFKAVIPANNKNKLLNQLQMLGVHKATIFPGLDGVGQLLKNKYEYSFVPVNRKDVNFKINEK